MRIILGMTGASGTAYGLRLLELLMQKGHEIHLVMSPSWHQSAAQEGSSPPQPHEQLLIYDPHNYNVPIASGSVSFDAMVVAPCSGSSLGCIASGVNQHLIHRAAEVQLKERRRLILLFRESPLSLVHIQNMERVTLAGGIIQIAAPHFYTAPQTIQDVVDTVVERTVRLLEHPEISLQSSKTSNFS
ncbi:MAG: UbiX family flavin prenyltransferase [Planctomycetaceae bacterium]|jgi:4-hydroxy-3-polyprenylbenzoate decarboxylase|nr:UbiX family flavin prenyltransferase [Planctomycetaceae bacterium]